MSVLENDIQFKIHEYVDMEEGPNVEFKGVASGSPAKKILKHCERYIPGFLNAQIPGSLYCGIEDNGEITGVKLTSTERDEIQKVLPSKLNNIDPPIPASFYEMVFHQLIDETDQVIDECFVFEVKVFAVQEIKYNSPLHKTTHGSVYIRQGSTTKELNSEEIRSEYRKRFTERARDRLQHIQKELADNPEDIALLRQLADTGEDLGDVVIIREAFSKIIEIQRRSNLNLSNTYRKEAKAHRNIGDIEGAIDIIDHAESLLKEEDKKILLKEKGIDLLSLQQEREAIRIWIKLLKESPEDYTIYTQLGIAFRRLGDHEKSLKCFKKSLSICPQYRLAKYETQKTYAEKYKGGYMSRCKSKK